MESTRKIWNTACYARLSIEDKEQSKESESISGQKQIIRYFTDRHDEFVIVDEYADDGYSGVNFDRPSFKRMMDDIKAGKVNCIIVKDLSRFARNYIDGGQYLEKLFPFMGVRFIALNDNYDSEGVYGQSDALMLPVKNILNDQYCRDISMKTRSLLDMKRKNGEFIGAFTPYGYVRDAERKNLLVIDEEAAGVVRYIFSLRMQGMGNHHIAEHLNERGILCPSEQKRSDGLNYVCGYTVRDKGRWSAKTIFRILTNEVYVGDLIQHRQGNPNYKVKKRINYGESDWIVIRNCHEPIIRREDFDTVQSLLKRNVRCSPGENIVSPLSGYVTCGSCGESMVRKLITTNGREYRYLVCSSHKNGHGCTSHCISEKKLEKAVLCLIQAHIAQICEIDRMLEFLSELPLQRRAVLDYEKQLEALNSEITRYNELRLRLYGDLADGILTKEEYVEFRAGYERKINECQAAMAKLEKEKSDVAAYGTRENEWLRRFREFRTISELNREVVVQLIENIVVYDASNIRIDFRYNEETERAKQYIARFDNLSELEDSKHVS